MPRNREKGKLSGASAGRHCRHKMRAVQSNGRGSRTIPLYLLRRLAPAPLSSPNEALTSCDLDFERVKTNVSNKTVFDRQVYTRLNISRPCHYLTNYRWHQGGTKAPRRLHEVTMVAPRATTEAPRRLHEAAAKPSQPRRLHEGLVNAP